MDWKKAGVVVAAIAAVAAVYTATAHQFGMPMMGGYGYGMPMMNGMMGGYGYGGPAGYDGAGYYQNPNPADQNQTWQYPQTYNGYNYRYYGGYGGWHCPMMMGYW